MNEPTLEPRSDPAQTWNVLTHLSALLGLIFPLGFIFGPLVVWLIKRGEYPSVDANGKEALNFQLTCLVMLAISFVLALVLIGFVLMGLVAIYDVVMVIIAAVKTSENKIYSYPFTIKFIS